MKSRTREHATFGHRTLSEAVAAELVDKLGEYYLPWIREALSAVDDATLWTRPLPGVNSIGNLLLHLEGNVRQWVQHGLGGAADRRDRDGEFAADSGPDRWSLYERLARTVGEACEIIRSPRSDDEWLRERTIQRFRTTTFAAAIHVVEHFAYHTGQIVCVAKIASGRDLKFYHL
ncbi:MAG: hypothetical protein MAG453_01770 [Calditrichaeota bacterium]|nr:hypothetical protein [Calditrichota bacterium]